MELDDIKHAEGVALNRKVNYEMGLSTSLEVHTRLYYIVFNSDHITTTTTTTKNDVIRLYSTTSSRQEAIKT